MIESRRWSLFAAAVAMAALIGAAGCASTVPGTPPQHQARLRELQTQLLARADPDSLAAAALVARLLHSKSSAAPAELAGRAVAAAPDRADLVFLQLQLCAVVPACESQPLEARLRQLDPRNGAPWLYAFERAARSNDEAGVRAARAGLAATTYVHWYWTGSVSRTAAAVAGHAGFDTDSALTEVIGVEAALMTPLLPLANACSAQQLRQAEVLAQCRGMAGALRQGDTLLIETFGISLGKRLWSEGTPERQEVDTERRRLDYLTDLLWTRHSQQVNSPRGIKTMAALYLRYPSEQSAWRALCSDLGLNPEPPANWQGISSGS